MKKIIFITGAAGMVGSNLINKLRFEDKIVIAIDSLILGEKKNLNFVLKKKNFFFFKKDLSNKINSKKIENILKKNSLSEVWLLAANSDIQRGVKDHNVDLQNTFLTTINTLEYLKKYFKKNTKVIFTSSSAIYGKTNKRIDENTEKKNPESNYGFMKLASEIYLSNISKQFNFKVFIFRFPNVIGPNLTHGLLFDMINKILRKNSYIQVLGNGKQQKPYSHVSEIINCILYFKNKKFKKNLNFFNIGTDDNGVKVKYIVNKMVKKFKSSKKIIYEKKKFGWIGDVPQYKYSTRKIRNLGFKFKLSSKEAVNITIDNI